MKFGYQAVYLGSSDPAVEKLSDLDTAQCHYQPPQAIVKIDMDSGNVVAACKWPLDPSWS